MRTVDFDVIIIGAGHNGLVAGAYLARAGRKCLLLERRPLVGGPACEIDYFPGYRGSISNSPGSFEPKILAELELARFGLRFSTPDPSLFMPFPGGRFFAAYRDKTQVVEELRKFSANDARRYYEVFGYYEEFARALGISLFESPPSLATVLGRLQGGRELEMFNRIFFGSIRDLLDSYLESDEVKAIISILAVSHNRLGPYSPGSAYLLLQRPLSLNSGGGISAAHDPRKQVLRGSTGLPLGGMGAISAALRRSFEAFGGVVLTCSPVARIEVQQAQVTGVTLEDGQHFRAPRILSALNPKATLLDLLDTPVLDPELRGRVERIDMGGSAFKVGLALAGLPRWTAARNDAENLAFCGCQFRVAPSMRYMEEAYDDFKYGRWSRTPMLWGLIPSVGDPTMAPPGKHVMSINVFHAPPTLAEGSWETEKHKFGQHIIDTLAQYAPNIKGLITDCRFWSPHEFRDEYTLAEANISHGDMTPARMFGRPLPEFADYRTPVRGLYLGSGGNWPGGLVSGIPGHNASHRIIADDAGAA